MIQNDFYIKDIQRIQMEEKYSARLEALKCLYSKKSDQSIKIVAKWLESVDRGDEVKYMLQNINNYKFIEKFTKHQIDYTFGMKYIMESLPEIYSGSELEKEDLIIASHTKELTSLRRKLKGDEYKTKETWKTPSVCNKKCQELVSSGDLENALFRLNAYLSATFADNEEKNRIQVFLCNIDIERTKTVCTVDWFDSFFI